MVQDLIHPMLAQTLRRPLAAHEPTSLGVETNVMLFYIEASAAEAKIHPELYRRVAGWTGLLRIRGPRFD